VTTRHPIDEKLIRALMDGVQLIDEPAPIAALACTQVSEKVLQMTLAEGKYHQVKRMIAAVSNRVEALKRIRIGELALPDDLEAGKWRWLSEDDMARLGWRG
jgi:16S rRNA pseudouridine516 synthase